MMKVYRAKQAITCGLAGLCLAVGGATWAQSGTAGKQTTGGVGLAANPETKADYKFLMMAAQGNMAEIQMAQIAMKRGSSDAVKNYAQMLLSDHTKANEQVMQLAKKKGVTLPKGIDAQAQATMKKMSGMSGAKFDKMYASDMVKDHTKDITDYQNEAGHGYDDDIKGYATRTLPTLKAHLSAAQTLQNPTKGTIAPGKTGRNVSGKAGSKM